VSVLTVKGSALICVICGKKAPGKKDKSEDLLRDSDNLSVYSSIELNPDLVDKDSKNYEDQK